MKLPCLTGLAIRYIHYTVLEIQHSTNALYYYNNLHFYQYGYKVHGGFFQLVRYYHLGWPMKLGNCQLIAPP